MKQSFRQIKNRIHSIQNIRKITNAMAMISMSKFNRANRTLAAMRPYFVNTEALFKRLAGIRNGLDDIFLKEPEKKERALFCVVNSDNGLCGMYNTNIIRFAESFIKKSGREAELLCVGKKCRNYFSKKGFKITSSYTGLAGHYTDKAADDISRYMTEAYSSGQADEAYLIYTHYETALVQKPVAVKYLNIERPPVNSADYILEPSLEEILSRLVPHYLKMKTRFTLLEAFAAEHAARMVSMQMASDNGDNLLHSLTLQRNKVRQASITGDIMEIIASSEAPKG